MNFFCNCRGLDNAGKTTILKRLNGEDIDTIEPTLGFNINTLEHRGYTLNFWDVGGQKSLRSYWRNYFEETDGLVWVVDSADKMRLENCRAELNKLLQEERLAGATLLVLANKQDVPGALPSKEIKDVCIINFNFVKLQRNIDDDSLNRYWNWTKLQHIIGASWVLALLPVKNYYRQLTG